MELKIVCLVLLAIIGGSWVIYGMIAEIKDLINKMGRR